MILPSRKTAAKVAISRFGQEVSIVEPIDNDNLTDRYGKKKEDVWDFVADEPVVRIYERGTPQQSRVAGGRYRNESPILLFMRDSAVAEGYRVSYGSNVYEIDSLTFYPSHIEAETTSVN